MSANSLNKKTAIVAGGAGFIGSHLCKQLLNNGYHVKVLDNLYTGSIDNMASYMNDSHFEFIQQDITTPFLCNNTTFVFNLACPASPIHYRNDAIFTTRTAVIGTLNMLELARRNNCPMLQASTSEIYGNPLTHPQTEQYNGNVNTTSIRACYDEGKRCAESLCMDYYRQYGTKVKIVRIFNTYGPHMSISDGRVVSNLIVQALTQSPITIYGDGSQTRSFMYIDDLIEGMMRMLKTSDNCTGPINLGNPDERTILNLAEIILRHTSSTSSIIHIPQPQDDPCRRCPDISLASKLLNGWQPSIGIHEGIQKTVDYFREQIGMA